MSSNSRRVVFLLGVGAMAVFCATHLSIGTDITNFMPDGGRAKLASLSRKLANSELTRTMILSVGAADLDRAVEAAADLEKRLADNREVAWIRTTMAENVFEEALDLYFPRRFYFASDDPERELPARLDDRGLKRQAVRLLGELRQPTSPFLKPLTIRDPLGFFRRFLEDARKAQPNLPTYRGQIVSADHRYALIVLGTVHSHFASDVQAAFLDDLRVAIGQTRARFGDTVSVESSGANRIAVQAEQSIKRDVYVIGACTFTGVALLFLLFFRSLHAFVLASLPALFGILCATSAGIVALGGLDGLTIAFGTALMGVAIDYSIHVINHYSLLGRDTSPADTVRRLAPSLTLGAATTMASFAGLVMTTSPAFRELGFFSIVGIGASLLATLYFLPDFLSTRDTIPELSRRVARSLAAAVTVLQHHRGWLRAATIVAFAAGLLLLPRLHWVDDLSRLGNADPGLIAEDVRVRSRLPGFDTRRFIIAMAGNTELALRKNDLVYSRMAALEDGGVVGGVRSLHQLVRSQELQQRNLEVLRSDPSLPHRVDEVFHSVGFRRGAFSDAFTELATPPPPLTVDDLRDSALRPLLSTLVLHLGDGVAVITYLRDIRSPAQVGAAIADIDGVVLFDQRTFVNQVYAEFRATTLRQIAVGTFLVALVLLLRYRALRPAVAAILPSLLVVVTLLGGFALFDVEINLLHIVSLMMVMGMGVDYGVFLVDTFGEDDIFGATMLSLLISCLTTVFVFGALAISEHPALRAMGVTTGCGVLLAFLFAPVSLIVTKHERPR